MRDTRTPNRLIEDLEWRHMLCQSCEALFSKFESVICEDVFLPIHENRQDRFRYGPSFARFAVSVVWRALVVLRTEGHLGFLTEMSDSVDAAERAWREFLLSQRRSPAPFDLHALPLDVPIGGPHGKNVSPHFNRFMLRGIGTGTRCNRGSGAVIVKMARLMVIGIVGYGDDRWKATKLHAGGGSWGVEIYHVPGWIDAYLKRGALEIQTALEGLSERQQDRTYQSMMVLARRDPEAFRSSGVFQAFLRDHEFFGERAFQKPWKDENSD
jgi:hypothetical protein